MAITEQLFNASADFRVNKGTARENKLKRLEGISSIMVNDLKSKGLNGDRYKVRF